MLFLNREHINKSSVFSLDWWEWNFTMPNCYLADGIKDFLDSKQEIEPTPKYVEVLGRHRQISGWAVVSIMGGCTYERKYSKEEQERIEREAKEKAVHSIEKVILWRFFSDDRPYPSARVKEERLEQIYRSYLKEISNGILYNATGTLDVIHSFDLDIPHGSYHLGAMITYHPTYDVASLQGVFSPEDFSRPQKEKQTLKDLLDNWLPVGDPLPQLG